MSWRIFTHHTLKLLLRAGQVVVFVLLPASLAYLHVVGLPKVWHAPIVEAARKEGIDLDFSRLRLSLWQGPVLDHVSLRAANLPQNHDISVERAAVSLDWRRLLRGRVELSALDLRGAQFFFPVATRDGVTQILRLTNARVRLAFADGVISIPVARMNLQGIDIAASGQVRIGQKTSGSTVEALPMEVGHLLNFIETLDFGETAPSLELEFSADTGDLAQLSVPHFEFIAPHASRGDIVLREIDLDGSYGGQTLKLERLRARDAGSGVLDASGEFSVAEKSGRLGLRSTLDPRPLLDELAGAKVPADLVFQTPPLLQADVHFATGEKGGLRVLGTFDSGPVQRGQAELDGLSAEFVWHDGDLYARDINIKLPTGTIQADIMLRPGDTRLRLDCQADPTPLLALLDGKAREGIDKMELKLVDPPKIKFEALGTRLDAAALTATGTIELGRTSIHNSEIDSASANLNFADLALALTDVKVARPEGTGRGAFTYDFGQQEVRLQEIRSTMNPFNVLQWADPRVAAETKPYRFKAPPSVVVNGVVGLKDPTKTRLRATFEAASGMDYDLLERTLNFGAMSGTLDFAASKIGVKIPSAQLFGGKASIDANITTGQPAARQALKIRLDRVNFESLTRLYFDYKDSQGSLTGRYDFSFIGGQERSMRGEGSLRVENGNVFAIPVLGPLSLILGTILPGTGYQTARVATCDFTVDQGVINTDNLDVLGQGFSMIGQGKLFYLEDRMDFGVRINAQGAAGLLLYPVSKLFEYVSDGTISEPKWRPRILPKGGGTKAPGNGNPGNKPSASAKPNGRA